jgi:hypothetical protein
VEWTPWEYAKGYDIIRQLYYEDGGEEKFAIMASVGEPVLPLSTWVMKKTPQQAARHRRGVEIERGA